MTTQARKPRIGPERRLMLRIANAAVPTLGVWSLAALASCSHQSVYDVVGKARYSGLVEALPLIRAKWSMESGSDEFEPWLRALTKALPVAFTTCASVLPEHLRPPVPGLQEENFPAMITLHATNLDHVEASLIKAVEKLETHFDKLCRLLAAVRRNTEMKAA